MQGNALAGRQQVPIRFDQLKRAPGLRVIGVAELVGLALAALLALVTVFAYFYFYVPAHLRLTSTQLDRDRLQAQLRASEVNLKDTSSTREAVDKINASMEDFESNWLAVSGPGRISLYTELNRLIKSNGVRNTAGPTYTPLEPMGSKSQVQPTASAEKQSNAKWQTIYPGVAVTVTVEGSYQNVRHFVRDIETSRQFLIINAVELEGLTQSGVMQEVPAAGPSPVLGRGAKVAGPIAPPLGGRGTLVSLRLDMATYFQRTGTQSTAKP